MLDAIFCTQKPMNTFGTVQLRCFQPCEYLRSNGWQAKVGRVGINSLQSSRSIILHRGSHNRITQKIVDYGRSVGAALISDYDDDLFSQDIADDSGTKAHKLAVTSLVKEMDMVTVSTPYLSEVVKKYNPNCHVLRNSLSDQYLSFASRRERQIGSNGFVTLCYFSGSAYHDQDFLLIQDQLIHVLKNNRSVRLILAGKLNFSEIFYTFGDRFEYYAFMPYVQFIKLYEKVDVNLVPLRQDSILSQGRSELKYIEAGAFAIPTLASPTSTYSQVIENGRTGLLVKDSEWASTLHDLIGNRTFLREIGQKAKQDILSDYSPNVRASEWNEFMKSALEDKQFRSRTHLRVIATVSLWKPLGRMRLKAGIGRFKKLFCRICHIRRIAP